LTRKFTLELRTRAVTTDRSSDPVAANSASSATASTRNDENDDTANRSRGA